jgi:putative hemolysin
MEAIMDKCGKGHDFDEANTYIDGRGKRNCRECRRLAAQRFRDREDSTYRQQHKKLVRKPKADKPKRVIKEKVVKEPLDMSPIARFMRRLSVAGNGCWIWLGGRNDDGYGVFCLAKRKNISAHRFSYQFHRGEIEKGLEVDHLCSCRSCVNPEHLELVTHAENIRRGKERGSYKNHNLIGKLNSAKTHCKNGHPYQGDNLIIDKYNGGRRCKICEQAKSMRYREKIKANKEKA